MKPGFDVYVKIARPVADVFEAITDPGQLSTYFTTGGASAALVEGATVIWKFGDYPGEVPVKVTRLVPNERIELSWEAEEGGYDTRVVMTFEALNQDATLVRVAETGWHATEAGQASSYKNCFGWTQMICCLKAHVEYGINLRRGFF